MLYEEKLMKKTKIIILLVMVGVITTLVISTNVAAAHNAVQETSYAQVMVNQIEQFKAPAKINSPQQDESVLGWEVGDQQANIQVPGFTITAICAGIYEDTVVLVEDQVIDEFPESRGRSIAKFFQERIYDPTEAVYGVPRLSIDYNTSDIALVIVDTTAHSTSWAGVYGGQYNGYEQITVDKDIDWGTVAHEYQHCIHRNLRSGRSQYYERWINEGMSEFWPGYLGIEKTNRCSDHYMEAVEQNYKQNIPLMEFAPRGSPYYTANYGMGFMFTFYLYDHFGMPLVDAAIRDYNYSFHDALNRQLPKFGYDDLTFTDIFFDFQLAFRVNDVSVDPRWGYKGLSFFTMNGQNAYATNYPLDLNFNVFHWAGDSVGIGYSGKPDHVAVNISFDGSAGDGYFDVHAVTNTFVDMDTTKKFVTPMTLDNDTQTGSLIVFIPNDVSLLELNVANANGPDYGYDVADSEAFAELRDPASVHVEPINLEVSGTIDDSNYDTDAREIAITASLDWDLDQPLHEAGFSPTVQLYDEEGEFGFNVETELNYEDGQWTGVLTIPEDIADGKYKLNLMLQGLSLEMVDIDIGAGVGVPGFIFMSLSLTLIALALLRKRRRN